MLKDYNIICISSIDWDFLWQRHQEIMSAFAKNGNRVLFIENTGVRVPRFGDIPRLKKRVINWIKSIRGFREETANLYIYSPILLPFPYSGFARWLNRHIIMPPLKRWMEIMRFYDPIIWTYLPNAISLDIIDSIEKKLLVYDCVANFEELADNPGKIHKTETKLIKESDIIFAQGKMLMEKCARYNNNVHIFSGGVSSGMFSGPMLSETIPVDIKEIKRPIIGYAGGIHKHIDFELIKFIANTHPEWSIVMIGPAQTDVSAIKNLANVFLLGKKDFHILPYYLAQFDAALIPYLNNKYTDTVFPTKVNEYFALGKPVISTPLPEIIDFNTANNNIVLISGDYNDFSYKLAQAVNSDNEAEQNARVAVSKKNSWDCKIEEMSVLIEKAIKDKTRAPVDWEERLSVIYRRAKRKISHLAAILLTGYLLLFYTPFIWMVAAPLKISQVPKNADAIVVFAGGVGESGMAGEGYQERVQSSVELYKNGYAKYIIFSSGYTHLFKEPLVMQALAVSLGVPKEVILLEGRATNTYENVIFSSRILKRNNWHNILLVSSPYHMRRVRLVFQKNVSNVDVTYLPFKNSFFYRRTQSANILSKKISLQQIEGIMHEYLGILYYWWKGYI